MSSKDNHDASRDQYISHKLYLERRHGNRYYNLGYTTYKGIVSEPQTISPTYDILKDCIKNFDMNFFIYIAHIYPYNKSKTIIKCTFFFCSTIN